VVVWKYIVGWWKIRRAALGIEYSKREKKVKDSEELVADRG
jgi:hypothetical protein